MPYRKEHKKTVALTHPCHLCGIDYSTAKSVINHYARIHGYDLPARPVGRKRPLNLEVDYQHDLRGEYDELHYACCSCWYTCPEGSLPKLGNHIMRVHKPKVLDAKKTRTVVPYKKETNKGLEKASGFDSESEEDLSEDMDYEIAETEEEGDKEEDTGDEFTETKNGKAADKNEEIIQTVDAAEILDKLTELTNLFKTII